MTKIKIIATMQLAPMTSNRARVYAETPINFISPIVITSNNLGFGSRRFSITPYFDLSSVAISETLPYSAPTDYNVVADGGNTNPDGSRLVSVSDVPGLDWKSSGVEIVLPSSLNFDLGNFVRVIYRTPLARVIGFASGDFDDGMQVAVRVYVNDVLVADPVDAIPMAYLSTTNPQGATYYYYENHLNITYPAVDGGWGPEGVWTVTEPGISEPQGVSGGGELVSPAPSLYVAWLPWGIGGAPADTPDVPDAFSRVTLRRSVYAKIIPGTMPVPAVPGHWVEIPDPPPPPPAVQKIFPFGVVGTGGGLPSSYTFEYAQGVTGQNDSGGSTSDSVNSRVLIVTKPDGTSEVIRV